MFGLDIAVVEWRPIEMRDQLVKHWGRWRDNDVAIPSLRNRSCVELIAVRDRNVKLFRVRHCSRSPVACRQLVAKSENTILQEPGSSW